MADEVSSSIRGKIFPRNLTARAAHQPRGNPPGTRPESGVDNCVPGLDFDTRHLEDTFFPGLRVSFHGDDGAEVIAVQPERGAAVAAAGLTNADLPLYIWGVAGRVTAETKPDDVPRLFVSGMNGLDVWRRVRAIMPGPVSVLLAPPPRKHGDPPDKATDTFTQNFRPPHARAERKDGQLVWAVLVDQRQTPLDADGVIDRVNYDPGDLTRTLCVPWQYDFRDCGCYYWASNKPDLVTNSDGRESHAYFMRRDHIHEPPPPDKPGRGDRDDEIDYTDLIGGSWNDVLPVVLNDREQPAIDSSLQRPKPAPLMDLRQVIDELTYLATVEHALAVEYLFAHYSLDAPMVLPGSGNAALLRPPLALPAAPASESRTSRIFAAAYEVFMIAVDEMRHLRWVNEALALLDQKPSFGRAPYIGRQLHRKFELKPLTRVQLAWFIEVEQPSQSIDTALDGMYVHLLRSVEEQPHLFKEAERLIALIKLIIDEGIDHYHRFLSVQQQLDGMSEEDYLRPLRYTTSDPNELNLLDLADGQYHGLLYALAKAFDEGDFSGGTFLEHARRSMQSLHEINHLLVEQNLAPRFKLPESSGVQTT